MEVPKNFYEVVEQTCRDLYIQSLKEIPPDIVAAIKRVAEYLGNTPTVCRGSYIHPAVLKCYETGVTLDEFRPKKIRRIKRLESEYEPEEAALLRLFKEHSKL